MGQKTYMEDLTSKWVPVEKEAISNNWVMSEQGRVLYEGSRLLYGFNPITRPLPIRDRILQG
jgi:hypothetical protein